MSPAAGPAARRPVALGGRRVLVTGATGALGRPVVAALLDAGAQVHALLRSASASLPADVVVHSGDLTDPPSVRHALEGMDAVVHLAALLHVTDPPPALAAAYRRVNDEATAALAAACLNTGVDRLVYASTIAVYGRSRPPEGLIDERTPCLPVTPYARTKLAGERHVIAARHADGRPLGVVLRLAAVYGAGVKGNYLRLVQTVARGRYLQVGSGENRRALVHEDDCARAIVLALATPHAAGGVYNVTDAEPHRVRDIVAAMAAALGRPRPRIRLPVWPVRVGLRAHGMVSRLIGRRAFLQPEALDTLLEDIAVDGGRLRADLGFVPAFDLDAGWRDVVARMREAGDLPGR